MKLRYFFSKLLVLISIAIIAIPCCRNVDARFAG